VWAILINSLLGNVCWAEKPSRAMSLARFRRRWEQFMPRGKTIVMLRGGDMDGETLSSAPTRMLTDVLRVFAGSGFAQGTAGKVAIFTGASCLPTNWICYKALQYRKLPTNSAKDGVVYEFFEDVMIDRCASLTKAGQRCKNEVECDSTVCKVHAQRPDL
jgi:hypothetical protein